jgi:hypothetical protein
MPLSSKESERPCIYFIVASILEIFRQCAIVWFNFKVLENAVVDRGKNNIRKMRKKQSIAI